MTSAMWSFRSPRPTEGANELPSYRNGDLALRIKAFLGK